ncbi:MAG: dephospho-CoA kinase [Balneolaceae bacterium]|nr:dephospho-CoA kinase [Balneolaceae bacterium]
MERVQKRDKVPEENVLQRIEKQQNFEEKIHLADYVIYNNGTLEELEEKSKKIFHELVAST